MVRKIAYCTPAIFESVLSHLRAGITISQVIELNRDNPEFPCDNTIRAYISSDNVRMNEYTHAREIGADALADSTIYIADTVRDAAFANNRIKARQWLASKLKPKVYGDKLDLDVTGRVDIAAAIGAARQRALLPTDEPLIIEHEEQPIDPFS